MKFISHAAMVLCVFMVVSTIDAVPDPPAVAPHTVDVKVSCLRDFVGSLRDEPLTGGLACDSLHDPMHHVSPVEATERKLPSDWVALAGYAADSSPPLL
jgi:hypothetical protein